MGRYIQVRSDQADAAAPIEKMIGSASSWLHDGCRWELVSQEVTVIAEAERTLREKCGSVVVDSVAEESTHALVVGFSPASPLTQRHILQLGRVRRESTDAALLVVQFMEVAQLSSAIEFNTAMLGGDPILRPVMVLPVGATQQYVDDFDGALARYGLRLVTEQFGITVYSIGEVAAVLKRELVADGELLQPGRDCIPVERLRRLAKGSRVPGEVFGEALSHISVCSACSTVTWDFATIDRFGADSVAIAV